MDEIVFQTYEPLTEFTATILRQCHGLTIKRLMPSTRSGQAELTRLSVKGSLVFFILEVKFYISEGKGFLRVYLRYPESMAEHDEKGKLVPKIITLFKQNDMAIDRAKGPEVLKDVINQALNDPKTQEVVTKRLNSHIVRTTGGVASALTRDSAAVLQYTGKIV
jgi:hypothetical protein